MKKIGFVFVAASAAVLVLATTHPLTAGGLRTQLGEAVIENLQIGQTYNLKDLANLRLIVTNTSDIPVDLKMDVLLPRQGELRQAAEPIPDESWLSLGHDYFENLEPNEAAASDIIISIPDDDMYLGQKYQVNIWSHTVGLKTGFLAYGLRTRLIFTIDSVRADEGENITASDASVEFSLQPEELHLEGVVSGKSYDLEEEAGLVLTISNPSDQKQTLKLQSRTVANSLATLTKEYNDAPDASYLQFSEKPKRLGGWFNGTTSRKSVRTAFFT